MKNDYSKNGLSLGKGCFLLLFLFSTLALQAYDFSAGDGTEGNPYQIATRADLNAIRDYVGASNTDKYFLQVADIDLSASNWTSIGTGSNTSAFQGKFNGGGYKIQNLKTTSQYGGLFAAVSGGAIIENVHIEGGTVSHSSTGVASGIAGIVGYVRMFDEGDIIIRNNSNSATINAAGTATTRAGGIIGTIESFTAAKGTVTVEKNINTGSVTGNGQRTGGIVGYVHANLEQIVININSNYNSGDVTGTLQTASSAATAACIGGIVGHLNLNKPNTSAVISNNINYAKIETTMPSNQSYIGGIAGHLQAVTTGNNITILFEKNFAGGSVIGNTANTALRSGGLVGLTTRGVSTIDIQYSVAAQTLMNRNASSGNRVYGGVGGGTGVVNYTSNYAYKDMKLVNESGEATITSTNASSANGADKTLQQLLTQATYSDAPISWNFTDTWQIANGTTLPYLQSQANRPGVSDDYFPVLEYTYNGKLSSPKAIAFNNAAPPVISVPAAIDEVSFTLTSEKVQASMDQNPVSLSPATVADNKAFTTSESGIHAVYFFQVKNTGPYYEGQGTANDPNIITTQTQLESITDYLSSHFKLANDIALTFAESSAGWTPIADFTGNAADAPAFTGTLDGDGHKIIGLWSAAASPAVGLFAKSSGTIKNLGIAVSAEGITGDETTSYYAGGLVGYANGGSITGSYVTGVANAQIGGTADANGGLVGTITGAATIEDSYATINVVAPETAPYPAGGLVGSITDAAAQIARTYATGGSALVGTVETDTQITNSFDAATLTKEADTYAAWNLETGDVWGIYDAYGYPYLKAFNNQILITPAGAATDAVYTGEPFAVSYEWTASDNYDAVAAPLTGAPAINGGEDLIDAGDYTFTSGTLDLKNPYYQISFRDDISIVISPASQTITFTPATALDMADETVYTLLATATSGLPVLFKLREADDEYAEIIDGNQLTLKKAGTIEVTAYLEPNANYTAAEEVTAAITISSDIETGIGTLRNAWTTSLVNGVLTIGGLASGEQITVCNAQGTVIYRQSAQASEQHILLPARGIYLLVAGDKKIKIVY
ncbi:MAG: hypothetical protein LBM08_12655 [Dysgonamonadaceae bacterium]|jgi:hypothetical protein|nr:hypothetical protein [Dysgonamonadaceae bacterium]